MEQRCVSTSHDQSTRVPSGTAVNVNAPLMSIANTWVDDVRRCGRSYPVISIVISAGRRIVPVAARNRVPGPMGPGEIFSADRMREL